MISLLTATILVFVGSSSCFQVDDDVFYTLVNRITLLEERVQKQENINLDQEDSIRFLSEQNGKLLTRVREQERLFNQLQTSSKLESKRRFVLDSEGPVAFSAVIAPTVIEHTKPNTAIKFETILAEYGGGYNNDTGIFVAPRTGLYLLSCSLLDHMSEGNHGNVMVHGEIMRNHVVLARVFAHAETSYRDQGANTIITKLSAGDQVWVRTMDNSDLGLGGQRYTSFSGYLLWQLQ